jgi:hypothetical protein
MYQSGSEAYILIQGAIILLFAGAAYNFKSSTKTYEGNLGSAAKFVGFGMLFVTIVVFERILINFAVLSVGDYMNQIQDALSLVGLILLAIGFSKLIEAAKNKLQ